VDAGCSDRVDTVSAGDLGAGVDAGVDGGTANGLDTAVDDEETAVDVLEEDNCKG